MTEYVESEAEKRKLYQVYKREIKRIKKEFDNEWWKFKRSWKENLVNNIDEVKNVKSDLPDRHTAVDVELKNGSTERWILFSWHKQWNKKNKHYTGFIRDGWWKNKETLDNTYRIGSNGVWPAYRIQIVLDIDKEFMMENKKITLKLTQGAGDESHHADFADKIKTRFNPDTYPKRAKKVEKGHGSETSPVKIEFGIPVDSHGTFFDACMSAIEKSFYQLVIVQRQFINDINQVYQESLNNKELDDGRSISL